MRYCSDGQLAQHKLAHPAGTTTTSSATAAATAATATAATATAGDTTVGTATADSSVQWQLRALTERRRDLTRRNSCSLGVCNG